MYSNCINRSPLSLRTSRGFTLIEAMIVVAIIGILGAIAYPSYTAYVQRGARAEARTALLEAQQFMERYYSANNRYSVTSGGTDSPTLPARLISIPVSAPRYTMTVAVTSNSYTLTATPQGSMTADTCGALTITNTGARGAAGDVTVCWK